MSIQKQVGWLYLFPTTALSELSSNVRFSFPQVASKGQGEQEKEQAEGVPQETTTDKVSEEMEESASYVLGESGRAGE